MSLKGIINYSHYLIENCIEQGETVIDATCGNGHDTLFLSRLVGENGQVYAFDIQKQAIETTRHLLEQQNRTNVTLILDNHANIDLYFQSSDEIGAAIFNLCYLPRIDKSIITVGETTIRALEEILIRLKRRGIVVLVVYHGHDGGEDEKETVLKYVVRLDQKKYNVLKYGFINQKNNPPFIIAIEKK